MKEKFTKKYLQTSPFESKKTLENEINGFFKEVNNFTSKTLAKLEHKIEGKPIVAIDGSPKHDARKGNPPNDSTMATLMASRIDDSRKAHVSEKNNPKSLPKRSESEPKVKHEK